MTSLGRALIVSLAILLAAPALAAASPPSVLSGPSTWGTAVDGEPLGSWEGLWDEGGEATTYARQWLLCDAEGESCEAIDGADGESYEVPAADIGSTLRLDVTATNGSGSATARSAWPIGPIEQADAPASASPPGVYGDAAAGQALLASVGEWGSRTGALAYDFQWRRCDSSGDSCADIAGADANSYSVAAADMAATLRVRVTATNAYGSDSADSDATAVVPSIDAPSSIAAPVVAGELHAGGSVYPADADWGENIGNPTYAYQWLRCDAAGDDCVDSGEESDVDSHVVSDEDGGGTLRVRVTATNPVGSDSATSAPAAIPAYHASTRPEVTGTPVQGEHLSASDGTWNGSGLSYAYQWRRCDSNGDGCADVDGATGDGYDASVDDVGATLRVAVTASGPRGSSTSVSDATGVVVAPEAPSLTVAPSLTGDATVGSTLSVSTGEWGSATGPLTYEYIWLRCSNGDCALIEGATAGDYTLGQDDAGSMIVALVQATGAAGSAQTWAGPTDPVTQP
jgi:hypothetical protein